MLETEKQRIENRQADLVVKANQGEQEFILHIEIQNNNQNIMPVRMLRYFTDITLGWPDFNIIQYLIYIGKAPLTMESGIKLSNLNYQYHIINMHQIDCSVFLSQNKPEAVVLAILCDFQSQDKHEFVRTILNRIQQLTQNNENQYRDCLLMLEVLSENRDLTGILKEEEEMLSAIKLEDLASYEIGIEKGIEKGMVQGIEKGIEKGTRDGSEKMLMHLLKAKFGSSSHAYEEKIQNADNEQLLKWSEQILTVSDINKLFQ